MLDRVHLGISDPQRRLAAERAHEVIDARLSAAFPIFPMSLRPSFPFCAKHCQQAHAAYRN